MTGLNTKDVPPDSPGLPTNWNAFRSGAVDCNTAPPSRACEPDAGRCCSCCCCCCCWSCCCSCCTITFNSALPGDAAGACGAATDSGTVLRCAARLPPCFLSFAAGATSGTLVARVPRLDCSSMIMTSPSTSGAAPANCFFGAPLDALPRLFSAFAAGAAVSSSDSSESSSSDTARRCRFCCLPFPDFACCVAGPTGVAQLASSARYWDSVTGRDIAPHKRLGGGAANAQRHAGTPAGRPPLRRTAGVASH